jgi:signal transduction histidine kinase
MRATVLRPRRRWWPRWTLRLRLTLFYGALFLVAGAGLLTITYELVANSPSATSRNAVLFSKSRFARLPQPLPNPGGGPGLIVAQGRSGGGKVQLQAYAGKVSATFRKVTAAQQVQLQQLAGKAQVVLHRQQSAQLGALVTRSAIALGIMAILSIGLGWLMAGRALRPVRTMGARARGISERNLHERLALEGPDDELKELGDTFDELLARLESAFESQRRFVANASHELRTPITVERTLVEVALADPDATVESLRGTCTRVLAASEQQERLIEALLTLARSQRGLVSRDALDLGAVAGEVLQGVRPSGVRVESELGQALTTGDCALVERLVGNLLDNALRYNLERDGWVTVWTGVRDGRPTLEISNSGPVVPATQTGELLEPFRRLDGERTDTRGAGLGLSIVAAIAVAHDAGLRPTPRPDGGLDVEVSFPAAAAAHETRPLEYSGIAGPRNLLS